MNSEYAMNPFIDGTNSFTDFIISELRKMPVGDARKIDLKGRTPFVARPTIRYAAGKVSFKIKTKTDVNGDLWIKRIS